MLNNLFRIFNVIYQSIFSLKSILVFSLHLRWEVEGSRAHAVCRREFSQTARD